MLLTEIDHIGIAVHDIDAAIAWHEEVFGATVEHREEVVTDGVYEALLNVAESYIQLLAPMHDESPVAKYLAKKGEGVHHIAYRVDNIEAAIASVLEQGYQMIDQTPRPGSRGTTIAFVHPKSAFGTLIELVQDPTR
jgi:methylmalonyl-CoA epimerase